MNAVEKVVQATTHRAEQDNGPAVLDGKLRWVSASLLTKGDHQSPGGCLRAWWYRYVERRPEPQRFGQNIGTKVHGEIEKYYETGTKDLGPIALSMLQHLPCPDSYPDPGILIEHRIGDFEVADLPVSGNADMIHEPEDGVIEVIDLKTTSSIDKWAKTEEELGNTIQMLVYGFWAYLKFMPETVRLSHVYGQSKGPVKSAKVTVALSRDEISERFWNRVELLALQCKSVATQIRAEEVDANPDACEAYGGCPHRGVCAVGKAKAYAKLFGGKDVGLLDRIKTPEVEAEKKRLLAEEAASKAPPGFADAVERIQGAGKGFPALKGEAMSAWCALKGVPPAESLDGAGFLGGLTVSTVADLLQLADELLEEGMKETPPSIVPPDAPPSVHPVPEEETQKRKRGRPKKSITPLTDTVLETTAPYIAANTPITPPERQAVVLSQEEAKEILGGKETAKTESEMLASAQYVSLWIFADALPPAQFKGQPLEPYIDQLCTSLCEAHGCLDIRAADERGVLGYSKWKGVIAARAKASPPTPGVYTVDTRSEIAFEVVSALRTLEGTFFVRSVR